MENFQNTTQLMVENHEAKNKWWIFLKFLVVNKEKQLTLKILWQTLSVRNNNYFVSTKLKSRRECGAFQMEKNTKFIVNTQFKFRCRIIFLKLN